MELPEIIGIVSPTEWNSGSNAMPSGSAHEFEEFARDCVRLADLRLADDIELRMMRDDEVLADFGLRLAQLLPENGSRTLAA